MKRKQKFRVRITDENHLTDVGSFNLSWPRIIIGSGIVVLFLIFLGACLLWLTPLKNNLPGYLKDAQRSATEENFLRLDSLKKVYDANQAYIDNLMIVLDTERTPADSALMNKSLTAGIQTDSLLAASREEEEFVRMMQEKEKYNLSVIAPLAAEGLRFYPVNPEGVFTEGSRESNEGVILLPKGSTVNSIADGRVIDLSSPALNSVYTLMIQHPNGFLSKMTGVGKPLVMEGETVTGGQPLALLPAYGTNKGNRITIEIWHNGTSLIPYKYLNSDLDNASMQ